MFFYFAGLSLLCLLSKRCIEPSAEPCSVFYGLWNKAAAALVRGRHTNSEPHVTAAGYELKVIKWI